MSLRGDESEGCPTEEDLAVLLGSETREAHALTKHVDQCSTCRELVKILAQIELTKSRPARHGVSLASDMDVGRYRLCERLGAGSMGVVYAAIDPQLGRRIALKLIVPDEPDDEGRDVVRQRWLREARAMAQLAHPNVVSVHDAGTMGEWTFIAMELIEGPTLSQWLIAQHRGWREILDAFQQAGEGLAAAHRAHIVHRDFKPDNVLIGADGRARVIDFGLARGSFHHAQVATTAVGSPTPGSTLVTRSDFVAGTPFYMAPEQLSGKTADERSDQFSFCVALWTALSGAHPFALDGGASSRSREIPRWLRQVVWRGLATDPNDRYSSMAALLTALAHRTTRRRWWLTALLIAITLVVAGVAADRLGHRRLLCAGADRKLAGVWDDDRRKEIERAVRAVNNRSAAASVAEMNQVLDKYTRGWVAMHRDACEATRVRGEQTEAVLGLRMFCLDARLRDLRALTERLAAGNDEQLMHAADAARALGSLRLCADVLSLSAPPVPPFDGAICANGNLVENRGDAGARALMGHIVRSGSLDGLRVSIRAADFTWVGGNGARAEVGIAVLEGQTEPVDYQDEYWMDVSNDGGQTWIRCGPHTPVPTGASYVGAGEGIVSRRDPKFVFRACARRAKAGQLSCTDWW